MPDCHADVGRETLKQVVPGMPGMVAMILFTGDDNDIESQPPLIFAIIYDLV